MNREHLQRQVCEITGASRAHYLETVQVLWSGYGEISRWQLESPDAAATSSAAQPTEGALADTVIVKYVDPHAGGEHPRGWNTDRSHVRKLRSYEVEQRWYRYWAPQCPKECRVAQSYPLQAAAVSGGSSPPVSRHVVNRDALADVAPVTDAALLVLEDLDLQFPVRRMELDISEITPCLEWLAALHATFLDADGNGLWPVGCYWHLETRPDEWQQMPEGDLKHAASWLDEQLCNARYQTLVHGDAKVANFCFSEDGKKVAAVDFQYVGRGPGVRDLVYFLGSCLDEESCRRYQDRLLAQYFDALQQYLEQFKPQVPAAAVVAEWRALYAIAWTDFYRFLQGWMPGHQKINRYTLALADIAISQWHGR